MHTLSTAAIWLLSVILTAGVAATSWFLNDEPAVTAAKIAVVPLYLLATNGLRTYFQHSAADEKTFPTVAKFRFADAALLAAFIVIVTTNNNSVASRMVMDFIWMTALIGAMTTGIKWLQQKRQNNAK